MLIAFRVLQTVDSKNGCLAPTFVSDLVRKKIACQNGDIIGAGVIRWIIGFREGFSHKGNELSNIIRRGFRVSQGCIKLVD